MCVCAAVVVRSSCSTRLHSSSCNLYVRMKRFDMPMPGNARRRDVGLTSWVPAPCPPWLETDAGKVCGRRRHQATSPRHCLAQVEVESPSVWPDVLRTNIEPAPREADSAGTCKAPSGGGAADAADDDDGTGSTFLAPFRRFIALADSGWSPPSFDPPPVEPLPSCLESRGLAPIAPA